MKKIFFGILIISNIFAQSSILSQFSDSFANIVEGANESVVTITTTNTVSMREYSDYFRGWGRYFPEEYESKSLGSGVIVDEKNAYIVTNHHVIYDERNDKPVDQIQVELIDKRVFKATVVGLDKGSDLAVLQIDAKDLKAIKIGDSDKVRVGEWVLAIGSPFSENLSHTVTGGIVSALGRNNLMLGADTYQDFIQTDAAINPGNSGGALLNLKGELIGINSAIISGNGRSNAGIGFAIPAQMVQKVMNDLIDKGYVVRSYLGIYMQDITEDLYEAMDLKNRTGAIVSDIVEDSPAEKAGLEEGDVIFEFEDKSITNGAQLRNLVSGTTPGTKVKLKINRSGKDKYVYVTLEERTETLLASSSSNTFNGLGLTVKNLSQDILDQFKIDLDISDINGVIVVETEQNSPADKAGLTEGDIILRVGRSLVDGLSSFKEELQKYDEDQKILMLVRRGNSSRYLTIQR